MNTFASEVRTADRQTHANDFLAEAIAGLSQTQKTLPCRFLYDEEGSNLFDQITALEEYYPTRTETRILMDNIEEIVGLIGRDSRLIEFGSGTSAKTRHLLAHLSEFASYVPIDISREWLHQSCAELALEFPSLEILPHVGDFAAPLDLPRPTRRGQRSIAFFPGSTIGNFEPDDVVGFLRNVASVCGPHGGFLIGYDLKKNKRVIERAYNDRKGVTARFNLNILARANRELGANFDLSAFRHHAPYNERLGRIEMHLISTRPQVVHLNGHEFAFETGEYITTEHSYKRREHEFASMADAAGFDVVRTWSDKNHWFCVQFLTVRDGDPKRPKRHSLPIAEIIPA
jgi:dimethylhistidine N-methyltransferase